MTDVVVHWLHDAHFAYTVERLEYPHAGHRAGNLQIVPAWRSAVRHPVDGRWTDFGGPAEGNAASSLDAIPRILAFPEQSLGPADRRTGATDK